MQWKFEHEIGIVGCQRNAIKLLRVAKSLPNLAAVQAACPGIFEDTDSVIQVPHSFTGTTGFVVKDAASKKVVAVMAGFDGTENSAVEVLNGWTFAGSPDNDNVRAPYNTGSSNLFSAIGLSDDFGWDLIVLIGYSLGGAIVTAVAPNIPGNFSPEGTSCYIYTFGAPKTMLSRDSQSRYDNMIVRRAFFGTDPVPTLPPGGAEIGDWITLSTLDSIRFTSWVQPCAGFRVTVGNPPEPEINPFARQTCRIPGSIAAWVTGAQCFGSADHALANYDAVVTASLEGATGGDDLPISPIRIRGETITPSERSQALNDTAALQSSIVEANPQGAVDQIAQNFPPIPGVKFHGVRFRGRRSIYFGKEFVTFVRGRRRQLSLVRYLNRKLSTGVNPALVPL